MRDRNLLKEILEATREVWDRPGTRPSVRENFAAVLDCGTAALGWEVYASDNEERRCYHRCKSRFCPSCGYRATLLWLEQQEAALPDIPYTGVVFTMPRELWPIFHRNRHLLHDLPALGASVIEEWIKAKYGARALIIVVPHTFGGDLKFNAHLHILVSAGGRQESTGQWISRLPLNKDALMRSWRYVVIEHLKRALKVNVLKTDMAAQQVLRLLATALYSARHPRWNIFIGEIESKAHFLLYAARYVRRPPIAMWRLQTVDCGEVCFVAKDTKAKEMIPRKRSLSEFIRILAAHVPERYQHAIRYYGLLAPRAKNKTNDGIFLSLGQKRPPRPVRLSWRHSLIKFFGIDPFIDSHGQDMHWVQR
jgi:hypothetical protein